MSFNHVDLRGYVHQLHKSKYFTFPKNIFCFKFKIDITVFSRLIS